MLDKTRVVDPIVVATEPWFNALMDATRLAHAENGQHELSLEKIAAIIWRGVTRCRALIGAIGSPQFVKGFVSLEIDPVYYSDEDQIVERIAFVHPDHRRSDNAKRLIRFAKDCSQSLGLDLVIGILSDHRLDAKRKLYERELPLGGYWFCHRPRAKVISNGEPESADASATEGSPRIRPGDGGVSS